MLLFSEHDGSPPPLFPTFLLFFSFPCFFLFLLGGWAGVSIPLVYMFLTAKLCLLFAFTPHDMTGFFLAWLQGCGKEWPDEFMQSGEINVPVGLVRREEGIASKRRGTLGGQGG